MSRAGPYSGTESQDPAPAQCARDMSVYVRLCKYRDVNELLSVDDVAERLQLRPRTIREYIRSGRLRATRIGKQYRIRVEDLDLIQHVRSTRVDGEPVISATIAVRIEAADHRQEERVFSLLNVVGGSPGVALQVARDPEAGVVQVVATGSLTAALDVLTRISNAMEATDD